MKLMGASKNFRFSRVSIGSIGVVCGIGVCGDNIGVWFRASKKIRTFCWESRKRGIQVYWGSYGGFPFYGRLPCHKHGNNSSALTTGVCNIDSIKPSLVVAVLDVAGWRGH